MPARLLVWLPTNGLMKIGHLYCYLIKYFIDDLLSLRMDPRNWQARRYIHDRHPRNPCERAGWHSFRGKGPDETKEREFKVNNLK